MANKPSPMPFAELKIDKHDMQGLLSRGHRSLRAACYIFMSITNVDEAKKYFTELTDSYVTTAWKHSATGKPIDAVHIAFTNSGIRGVAGENILHTFSREFIEGMSYSYNNPYYPFNEIRERSTLLGDIRNSDPGKWHWGSIKNPVDCVLMLYSKDEPSLAALCKIVFDDLKKGVEEKHRGNTFQAPPNNRNEHFGFRDGISQPVVKGLSKSENEFDNTNLINPGEFILGYENAFNNYSPSPYVYDNGDDIDLPPLPQYPGKKDLGKNGSYLVFRQMEQHVERFWNFHYNNTREAGSSQTEKAIRLAAKMVGRWPDGRPLVKCPFGNTPVPGKEMNDFNYATMDKDGVKCPLGAHIRRTNPRDQVHTGRGPEDSIEMSNKHRLLRRGRIYGEPVVEDMNIDDMICKIRSNKHSEETNAGNAIHEPVEVTDEKIPVKRGLHFICLVSEIGRQFEFVQSVWANTATFGDLCNEVDPLISPRPTADQPECHEFTTPQNIVRNRYKDVPEFTTVVGGAYFFMPGIKALKYLMSVK